MVLGVVEVDLVIVVLQQVLVVCVIECQCIVMGCQQVVWYVVFQVIVLVVDVVVQLLGWVVEEQCVGLFQGQCFVVVEVVVLVGREVVVCQ